MNCWLLVILLSLYINISYIYIFINVYYMNIHLTFIQHIWLILCVRAEYLYTLYTCMHCSNSANIQMVMATMVMYACGYDSHYDIYWMKYHYLLTRHYHHIQRLSINLYMSDNLIMNVHLPYYFLLIIHNCHRLVEHLM